jgi:hypothetical protein
MRSFHIVNFELLVSLHRYDFPLDRLILVGIDNILRKLLNTPGVDGDPFTAARLH